MTYLTMLQKLDDGTLDPQDFSHRAHVAVAWEALEQGEFFTASARFVAGLRRLVEAAGVPEKFHATITHAFMSVIAERRHANPTPDAATFLDQNPDLLNGTFLTSRFSPETLASPLARTVPLMPDLIGAPMRQSEEA
ncbi:hypothetical protein [Shimia sp.]|uniref:hypothetical protein n=1 Tax=Shimia sp. TaxID=1954381 RepID=UPI0032993E97